MIPKISAEDLKKMQDREGLVLQGCGGDLQEWEDGIHQMLAEEKILQNGLEQGKLTDIKQGGFGRKKKTVAGKASH